MPVMPDVWRDRLRGFGLEAAQIDTLLEGEVEEPTVSYLALIEEISADATFAKMLANWFVNLELPLRHDETTIFNKDVTNQGRLTAYRTVFELIQANKLSSTNAKASAGFIGFRDMSVTRATFSRAVKLGIRL